MLSHPALATPPTAREKIVGFYSTGPDIKPCDIEIDHLLRRYCDEPVFTIVDVRPERTGLPVAAYTAITQSIPGESSVRVFEHVTASVGASEPEEIGVEHLLRDVNDPSVSELAAEVQHRLTGLGGLSSRLHEIRDYLQDVAEGKLPVNNTILANIQNILNALPNTKVTPVAQAFTSMTNDLYTSLYIAALTRTILALHNLVNNKLRCKD